MMVKTQITRWLKNLRRQDLKSLVWLVCQPFRVEYFITGVIFITNNLIGTLISLENFPRPPPPP